MFTVQTLVTCQMDALKGVTPCLEGTWSQWKSEERRSCFSDHLLSLPCSLNSWRLKGTSHMTHFKFTAALRREVLVLSGSTWLGEERTGRVHCKVLITTFFWPILFMQAIKI